MKFDDLLTVPYLDNGRTMSGLDCYGLVIECFRREGKELADLTLPKQRSVADHVGTLNVREVPEPEKGLGVQFLLGGRLHIGYMISKRDVLHMTESGTRITPIMAIQHGNPKYFEVIG